MPKGPMLFVIYWSSLGFLPKMVVIWSRKRTLFWVRNPIAKDKFLTATTELVRHQPSYYFEPLDDGCNFPNSSITETKAQIGPEMHAS